MIFILMTDVQVMRFIHVNHRIERTIERAGARYKDT